MALDLVTAVGQSPLKPVRSWCSEGGAELGCGPGLMLERWLLGWGQKHS